MGQLTLFFSKKVIFFHFLFVFSILYPIFASEFYLNYAGLTKVDAKKALDATVAAIIDALKKGDKVQLVGFGTFAVTEKPAREGINPATKQKITIAAKKVAKFKAGAELADAVK